jgi:3D (Asp-Asp-Asp) domain-containing protein
MKTILNHLLYILFACLTAALIAYLTMPLETKAISTYKEEIIISGGQDRQEIEKVYLGEFTITAYCSCPICCGKSDGITYTGDIATEGITAGADKSLLNEVIEIEGLGYRTVQDVPAKRILRRYKGKVIDIYISDHETASHFKKKLKIWIIK